MRKFLPLLLALSILLGCALTALADEPFAWTLRIAAEGSVSADAMYLLPDGGAYLAGRVEGDADCGEALGGKDAYLAAIGPGGEILWQKRFGGSEDDRFTHVVEGLGGGCLALGVTESSDGDCRAARGMQDAFLVRIDENGETLWTKCLGGSADDELLAISRWEEGGYLVCGRTRSRNGDLGANYGGWDAWAALLSEADGKPQWVVRYGEDGDDRFSLILPQYDHWTLVGELGTAATDEEAASAQPAVVTLDSSGAITREQTLGGDGRSALVTALETESGWLLAGQTNASSALMPLSHGGMDVWALLLRQSGSVSWQRTYGGSRDESIVSTLPASAGGYLYLAETQSGDGQVTGGHGAKAVWVMKATALGSLEWQQTLGGSRVSTAAGIVEDGAGGYLVAGSSAAQDGDIGWHTSLTTGFLARLAANGNLLSMELIGGAEEFHAVQLARSEEGAYLLGAVRRANTKGIEDEIWLGKLAE